MRKLLIFFLTGILCLCGTKAQTFNISEYRKVVNKTKENITVDGILNENTWKELTPVSSFYQHFPMDTIESYAKTEVFISYDEKYLYVASKCYENQASPVIQSLKRDDGNSFWMSDAFSLTLDPYNKNKNGYFFGVTALGSKVEGTLSQTGIEPALDVNWNTSWQAAARHNNDGYVYEIAIPFSSFKYNSEIKTWGINFIRNDMKRSVYDIWTRFPKNNSGLNFGYNGELIFNDDIPENNGSKLELTPSLSGKSVRDFEEDEQIDYQIQGGVEAKIALNSKMNVDLSIYPDFSTVEVDQQYISFNQHEYFMPEQRQFFLENNDLFASFGSYEDYRTPQYVYRIKPLYTRRIGIVDWEHVPMIFGTRFSGNITKDLRIGMLDVQIDKTEEDSAQNFSAVTFQQSLFKGSNIKGMLVNRQSTDGYRFISNDYNRSAGAEFDYLTKNNKWSVMAKYHQSFNPVKYNKNNYYGGGFAYSSEKIRIQNWYNHVGKNYINDAGYIPRLYHKDDIQDTTFRIGYNEISLLADYTISVSGSKFNQQLPFFRNALIFHDDGSLNEIQQDIGYYIEFSNRSSVYGGIYYNYIELLYPFDFLDNDKPVRAGKYDNYAYVINWNSVPTAKLQAKITAHYGNYYSGKKLFTEGIVKYRIQPWGSFQISYARCNLDFSDEFGSETYHLFGARSEIAFSKDMFWTTLVQHNTQKNTMNFNSLLQWRFRPMSDFYIVVKDDISIAGFEQQKFQIICKLSYWLRV